MQCVVITGTSIGNTICSPRRPNTAIGSNDAVDVVTLVACGKDERSESFPHRLTRSV